MVQRCSSIRRERCAHHPECIELVTHRYDKVFLGTAQFLLREALSTSRDAVAVIEVTITGPNVRAHSSPLCYTRQRFATNLWDNSRHASTNEDAMTSCMNSLNGTANITHRSRYFAVCSRPKSGNDPVFGRRPQDCSRVFAPKRRGPHRARLRSTSMHS